MELCEKIIYNGLLIFYRIVCNSYYSAGIMSSKELFIEKLFNYCNSFSDCRNFICNIEIKYWKREEDKIQERNERAQKILSNITELVKCKSKFYRQNTYKINFVRKEMPYYYNIHAYLYEVCQNLRSTIADIINQDISYVDVSLVYKYCDEKMWKWIAGKSGTSAKNRFEWVYKNKDTLFSYVLENEDEMPTFCNDKKENKHYKREKRPVIRWARFLLCNANNIF